MRATLLTVADIHRVTTPEAMSSDGFKAKQALTKWAAEMLAVAKPQAKAALKPLKPVDSSLNYVPSFNNNSAAAAQRASSDRLDAVSNLSMPT
jgi:hypothetical protein